MRFPWSKKKRPVHLTAGKNVIMLPLPNEHSARLIQPGEFKETPDWSDDGQFRRTSGGEIFNTVEVPETIGIIWGQLKDQEGEAAAVQSLRFSTDDWTAAEAEAWLKEQEFEEGTLFDKVILFEPASGNQSAAPAGASITLTSVAALAGTGVQWDRKEGTIRNVSVITAGGAVGHPFSIDETTLQQVAAGINEGQFGLKSRCRHPVNNILSGAREDDILLKIGRLSNARVEAGHVRANFQMGQYAKSLPGGDMWKYIFDLVEDDQARGEIGLSIAAERDEMEGRTEPINGKPMSPALRLKRLDAIDWTGDPAANPDGLLSRNPQSAPLNGARNPAQEEAPMNEALKKYLESIGLKADATEEEAQTFLNGLEGDQKTIAGKLVTVEATDKGGDAEPAPDKAPEPDPAETANASAGAGDAATLVAKQAVNAQLQKLTALENLAKKYEMPEGWATEQLKADISLDQASTLVLAHVAERNKPIEGIHVGMGSDLNRDTIGPAITDALLLRAGVKLFERDEASGRIQLSAEGKPVIRSAHERAKHFSGLTLVDMGRHWLASIGAADAFQLSRVAVVKLLMSRRALTREYGAIALAQSTSDFDFLLEDAMGRSLRAAYVEAPSTWQTWARRAQAPDFKDVKRVSMSESPDLVAHDEDEELQYVTIGDGKEEYALAIYKQGIKLTWVAIVNDDLDAFSRIPTLQANAAKRKEDDVCWAVITGNAALADGIALFHADHSNLAASGAAPSTATLNAMRAAMRKQTGPKGATLNITPRFLGSPAALEGTIVQLIAAETDPSASAAGITNIWKGQLFPVVEPRLDANSATAWYAMADSGQIDTVEVLFLEDEPEPVLAQETEFETDARKYKVRHSVAAKAIDHRGLYKDPGV